MNTSLTKTVFVTGGTGFVGSYLIRHLLNQGYTNIRALKRPTSKMQLIQDVADQVEWVVGDVLDIIALEDGMAGVDLVFHCAAVIEFAPQEQKKMMEVNRVGTANMVNIALHAGVKKFIHVSSIESLGQKDGITFHEKTRLDDNINSGYGLSKQLGEQEVWRGIAEGLNAVIVNPGVILGVGIWDEGPLQFFKLGAKGYPLYPSGKSGIIDVKDLTRFMVEVAESDITNERFILVSENVPYKTLMDKIAAQFGSKPPSIKISSFLRSLFWRLEWLRSLITGNKPLMTRESARTASAQHQYDNTKSIEALQFEYTPLDRTIQEAVEAFRLENQQRGEG